MAEVTGQIYVEVVQQSCRDVRPYAMPAQVFAHRLPLGAPACRACGEPYYPEIHRSPASEDHDQGQIRGDLCGPCQRWRYLELDLIAAKRAGMLA